MQWNLMPFRMQLQKLSNQKHVSVIFNENILI